MRKKLLLGLTAMFALTTAVPALLVKTNRLMRSRQEGQEGQEGR